VVKTIVGANTVIPPSQTICKLPFAQAPHQECVAASAMAPYAVRWRRSQLRCRMIRCIPAVTAIATIYLKGDNADTVPDVSVQERDDHLGPDDNLLAQAQHAEPVHRRRRNGTTTA
jgi:hypothetical protein